jgi:hypothetical protein
MRAENDSAEVAACQAIIKRLRILEMQTSPLIQKLRMAQRDGDEISLSDIIAKTTNLCSQLDDFIEEHQRTEPGLSDRAATRLQSIADNALCELYGHPVVAEFEAWAFRGERRRCELDFGRRPGQYVQPAVIDNARVYMPVGGPKPPGRIGNKRRVK